ncbi:hypothetical protein Q8F55_007386 [Vanrija albida]|uniref:Uncharacterized protein n=1 Tax=Vanrija albida TaxID=181172 RepID=A0ABR3PTE6_9TREE
MSLAKLDTQIQAVLKRVAAHAKNNTPFLLADHLAVGRMGPATLALVRDRKVNYVDNPATGWVLDSFKVLAPASDAANPGLEGPDKRAANASAVLDELRKAAAGAEVPPELEEQRGKIAERIDKRRASGLNPDQAHWFEHFRSEWANKQLMEAQGNVDFDGYPDSPASPSPKRYLNSFLSLIDALPDGAEVVLLSGSPSVLNHVFKFTENEGHVHTVLVDRDAGVVEYEADA